MPAVVAIPNRASQQSPRAQSRLFHLGLDGKDAFLIETMVRTHPELASQYVFGPPRADHPVDFYFVNGDSAAALATWQRLRAVAPRVGAVIVAADAAVFPRHSVLARPLGFRDHGRILAAIAESRRLATGSETLRILLVDDSIPARLYMQARLEECSATAGLHLAIDMADSGETALALAAQRRYDLAFVDVVMEGMDGYELCRRLKAMHPLRVAMLTGRVGAADYSLGREAGCDNYLAKPAHDADLRNVLQLTALRKLTAGRSP